MKAALSARFTNDERDMIEIEASIVPSCDATDDAVTALLCFKPKAPAYLDPLYRDFDDTQIDTEVGHLNFDKNFFGFTQLYPTPTGHKITAE